MMKAKLVSTLSLLILLVSCQTKDFGDFKLLPEPQEIEFLGTSRISPADLPVFAKTVHSIRDFETNNKLRIVLKIDEKLDLRAEGYLLNIRKNNIEITGKDQTGLFYAVKTLEQIAQDASDQNINLPNCKITDQPALAYRAIHIDVKHHLETIEYYYELIDWLASYKVNAIIAEVEDKIQYQRQAKIASPDAISIDDWNKLSNYSQERNIEISPLVQGLGHASFILKHDEYNALRDDPDSDWAFNPLDPETYQVQFDLYLDAMEAMPHGRYLHVGGDEVHTTGRNSGQSNLELQLIWLNKVCKFAEEHDRTPIFWDDMPLKHAGVYQPMFNSGMQQEEVDSIWNVNGKILEEFLDQFPRECVYMRWNYNAPQTYGNTKTMEWYLQNGLSVMGATAGQTRWVLMPQNQSNMENIKSFALSSIETGLDGLLLTLWDDDSPHFELYKRGILFFSEYTWSGDKRTNEDLKSSYRQREFSIEAAQENWGFIDELEGPVSFWNAALLKGNKRNRLTKESDPITESVIDFPDLNNPGPWAEKHKARVQKADEVYKICELVQEKIDQIKNTQPRNLFTLNIYESVNELVKFSAGALITLNRVSFISDNTEMQDVINDLSRLRIEFAALRERFENTYAQTRILKKPDDYVLDQDHHSHLANQTINFDWQFMAEMLFLDKLDLWIDANYQ